MARFTSIALLAVAALVRAQESTEVGISAGDLQTTLTLPAFPEPTYGVTETVVATSTISSGVETTTATIPFPPSNVTSITATTMITVPANTSTISAVDTAAQSSYISSLMSELTSASTSTVTASTTNIVIIGTGTGGLAPTNTTTGPASEFTGAGNVVKTSGLSVLGLVVFGVAGLIVV